MVVLAAVAGYALETESEWLFEFVPPIVGVVFLLHVQETNHVHYRHWQCCQIESRIEDRYGIDPFDWTTEFSPLTASDRTRPGGDGPLHPAVGQLPATALYLVAVGVYAVFLLRALLVVPAYLGEWPRWIATVIVPILYVVLSAALILGAASNVVLRVRAARSTGRAIEIVLRGKRFGIVRVTRRHPAATFVTFK